MYDTTLIKIKIKIKKRDFMFQSRMKSLIKYAIELDIDYIESFLGNEGDKVLEIITKRKDVIDLIKSYANNLDLDCRVEFQITGEHAPCYNLFTSVEDPYIYKLKKVS